MLKPILLIGAGGHAKTCIDVVESEGLYSIVGLVGTLDQVGKSILGYPIIGTNDDLSSLLKKSPHALVAIGQVKTAEKRIELYNLIRKLGGIMPSIVSPHAYFSKHATIGVGSLVAHGAIVNASASIGNNCIINTSCLIEHDVSIGDHCHISTKAVVNGNVLIQSETFIGSGAHIRHSINVGRNSVIGMGQSVFSNVDDNSVLSNKPF